MKRNRHLQVSTESDNSNDQFVLGAGFEAKFGQCQQHREAAEKKAADTEVFNSRISGIMNDVYL